MKRVKVHATTLDSCMQCPAFRPAGRPGMCVRAKTHGHDREPRALTPEEDRLVAYQVPNWCPLPDALPEVDWAAMEAGAAMAREEEREAEEQDRIAADLIGSVPLRHYIGA